MSDGAAGETDGRPVTAADVEDAHHAIQQFGGLINNADAKAGPGAAAVAALVLGVPDQEEAVHATLHPSGASGWGAAVLLAVLAGSLFVAVISIGVSLIPRTPPGESGGRLSFPTLVRAGWRFEPKSREEAATEAWNQASVLAAIVTRKFAAVKVTVWALGISFLACGAWAVLATLAARNLAT